MVWATEAGALILVLVLLGNSLLGSPTTLAIYLVAALFAVVDGLQRPSMDAMLPRLVSHEDLPAASALLSLRWQVGVIVGPTIGGIIFSTMSVSAGFIVDIATYVLSLLFLARVRSIPPSKEAETHSNKAQLMSLKY